MQWDSARWPNFTESEMACNHCGECHMDADFMDDLQALRDSLGVAVKVSSAYRCPEHNAAVGGAPDSAHTKGKAVDILCYGEGAFDVIRHAILIGTFTGLGVNQKGDYGKRFIHLDCMENLDAPRPWVWSY